MRTITVALICSLLLSTSAVAGTLTKAEMDELRAKVSELTGAFERGETRVYVEQTHESLVALAGGRDAFEMITQHAMDQLLQSGLKFVRSDVGTPTRTYAAGDEEVCFVPRTSIMEVSGRRVRSITFMIAVRKPGEAWKFLDGAGLRRNPDQLYRLLPELERGIALPPNTMEEL